jgi:predicted RNase H-like nuclease (RuvC/YqgF family)
LSDELKSCQAILASIQQANYYKRLNRKETEMNNDLLEHRDYCSPRIAGLNESVDRMTEQVCKKEAEIKAAEKEAEKLRTIVKQHVVGECARTVPKLKQKVKNFQTSVSDQKQINSELRDKQKTLMEKVACPVSESVNVINTY